MGATIAITHQNATVQNAMWYRNVIITALWTVKRGVVDFEENVTFERIQVHTDHFIWFMGNGT